MCNLEPNNKLNVGTSNDLVLLSVYKKRYPPLLSDKVWRLKEIRKEKKLHKRLQDENIDSVKEFLISHNMDPQSLQQKLSISAEKFKVIVDHAKTCKIPGNLYIYYPSCERNVAVVFDVVGYVQGLVHDDRPFVPVDNLAEDQKVAAHKMVISAFQNRKDIQLYDNKASISDFPTQVPNDVNTSVSWVSENPSGSNMGPNETTDELFLASLLSHMSPPFNDEHSRFYGSCILEPDTDFPNYFYNSYNHDDILQSANPRIEAHNVQNTGAAVCNGSSAHVHSSRKAKGRWKMVVSFVGLGIRSARKRNEAPEDTHAQKKQRHC